MTDPHLSSFLWMSKCLKKLFFQFLKLTMLILILGMLNWLFLLHQYLPGHSLSFCPSSNAPFWHTLPWPHIHFPLYGTILFSSWLLLLYEITSVISFLFYYLLTTCISTLQHINPNGTGNLSVTFPDISYVLEHCYWMKEIKWRPTDKINDRVHLLVTYAHLAFYCHRAFAYAVASEWNGPSWPFSSGYIFICSLNLSEIHVSLPLGNFPWFCQTPFMETNFLIT